MSTHVQPLMHHLQELRRRLLWCTGALILAGVGGYIFRRSLVDLVAQPLHQPLFYASPSGSFDFVMRICLAMGAVVALPILVYNLIRFVEPALSRRMIRRRSILKIITSSVLLAWLGLAFAYLVVLPASFRFFAGFNIGPIKPLISTSEYLSFLLGCLVVFAAIFQLPLVLLFFNSIRRFPPGGLSRYRRRVILGALVIALVLPFTYDPLTQFIVALPVIALYELSIILVWLVNRRRPVTLPRPAARRAEPVPLAAPQPQFHPRRVIQLG